MTAADGAALVAAATERADAARELLAAIREKREILAEMLKRAEFAEAQALVTDADRLTTP